MDIVENITQYQAGKQGQGLGTLPSSCIQPLTVPTLPSANVEYYNELPSIYRLSKRGQSWVAAQQG